MCPPRRCLPSQTDEEMAARGFAELPQGEMCLHGHRSPLFLPLRVRTNPSSQLACLCFETRGGQLHFVGIRDNLTGSE